MKWDIDGPYRYESEEVKELEALKLHPNLKSLKIIGFRGFHFPDWMNQSVWEKVVSINIRYCNNCSYLPPFGELPCLESLELWNGSAELEYVEEDDVHSGFRFPSLKKLHIRGFDNLKGLLRKEGEEQFSMLEEMMIWNFLMFVFPALSTVKKLEVPGTIYGTGFSSVSNLSTLTSLHISGNHLATSLPEEMFKSLANLEHFIIYTFKNLKDLPTCLTSLNALKRLEIRCCYILESLPEEGLEGLTSLAELSVQYREMLKSLPEGLKHLTTLTRRVTGCPELEEQCEEGIGEDWHKIAHFPNLVIGYSWSVILSEVLHL